MSPLRPCMLHSSLMRSSSHQILIFKVARWTHGSNIVRGLVCFLLDTNSNVCLCPRLLARGFSHYGSWFQWCARCIPGIRGTRQLVTRDVSAGPSHFHFSPNSMHLMTLPSPKSRNYSEKALMLKKYAVPRPRRS